MGRLLSTEDVLNATFAQTQFREGYDEGEVGGAVLGEPALPAAPVAPPPTPITRPPASVTSHVLGFLRGDKG